MDVKGIIVSESLIKRHKNHLLRCEVPLADSLLGVVIDVSRKLIFNLTKLQRSFVRSLNTIYAWRAKISFREHKFAAAAGGGGVEDKKEQ